MQLSGPANRARVGSARLSKIALPELKDGRGEGSDQALLSVLPNCRHSPTSLSRGAMPVRQPLLNFPTRPLRPEESLPSCAQRPPALVALPFCPWTSSPSNRPARPSFQTTVTPIEPLASVPPTSIQPIVSKRLVAGQIDFTSSSRFTRLLLAHVLQPLSNTDARPARHARHERDTTTNVALLCG